MGLLALCLPAGLRAQSEKLVLPIHPCYSWAVDGSLVGASAATVIAGFSMSTDRQVVPAGGLDPGGISLSLDRDIVGNHSTHADKASDYFRDGALVYPFVLMALSAPQGTVVHGTLKRSLLYAESVALAGGIDAMLKTGVSRPRPFTYMPADQRPADTQYDVEQDRAFQSMASGHATTTWAAANFAVSDYLISRPDASWQQRAGAAFVGSFLASTASALRVTAGQHFPTDVIVGGAIGTACGVGVNLLHRYVGGTGERAPRPPANAWWQALGGELAGLGAGLLAAQSY